jgi:hypothetical protein
MSRIPGAADLVARQELAPLNPAFGEITMRDAAFYFQLGFEHGYASEPQSYERDADYVAGYAQGEAFRAILHRLVPTVGRDADGLLVVTFAGISLRPPSRYPPEDPRMADPAPR